jgi:hypothetical protein
VIASSINNSRDPRIDSRAEGIANGLIFYRITAFTIQHPPRSSPSPFTCPNQIAYAYYDNTIPGSAQQVITSALRVWAAIDTLNPMTASSSPEQFAQGLIDPT